MGEIPANYRMDVSQAMLKTAVSAVRHVLKNEKKREGIHAGVVSM